VALLAPGRLLLQRVVGLPVAQKLDFLLPVPLHHPAVHHLRGHRAQGPDQVGEVEGLRDETVDPLVDRLQQHPVVRRGHQDHRGPIPLGPQRVHKLEPGEPGHHLVGEHQIGLTLPTKGERLQTVFRQEHLLEELLGTEGEEAAAHRVVFGDQDGEGAGLRGRLGQLAGPAAGFGSRQGRGGRFGNSCGS